MRNGESSADPRDGAPTAAAVPCPPMAESTPAGARALQTSRPWLTVAGCLGGSVVSLVVTVIVVIALVVWIFFPEWLPFGSASDRTP